MFYSLKKKHTTQIRLLGTVYLCLGCMWRIEGFLLVIPYVIVEIITDSLMQERKSSQFKSYLKHFSILLIRLALLISSRFCIMDSKEYSPSIEYSKYRTKIQDYPVLQYNQVKNELGEVTSIEFEAATNWVLIDTEKIGKELFEKISSVASVNAYPFSVGGLIEALKEMIIVLWQQKTIMLALSSFIFIIMFFVRYNHSSKYRIIQTILDILGSGLILLYFTIKGRAILHVWYSVLVILIIMLGWILCSREIKMNQNFIIALAISGFLIVSMMVVKYRNTEIHKPQIALTSRIENNMEKFEATVKNDKSVYIWGSWHKEITQYYMKKGKLPSAEFMHHNLSVGDWTYGQNYYIQYLEELNIDNPARALLERDDVYFVDDNYSFILDYLKEQYNDDIYIEQVGEINNIPVWKFIEP